MLSDVDHGRRLWRFQLGMVDRFSVCGLDGEHRGGLEAEKERALVFVAVFVSHRFLAL